MGAGPIRRANQALEQTRDSVLRYGESVGCELLNFFVLAQEAQSQVGVESILELNQQQIDE